MLSVEREHVFTAIGKRLARIDGAELDAYAEWLAASALELPTARQRQLAALMVEVVEAVAAGADPHMACAVLADALDERPTPGVRRASLRSRLRALHNPTKEDL